MRTGPLAVAGWVVAATLTLGVSWSAVQVVRSAVAPENLADSLPVPAESGRGTTTRPSPPPTATTPAASTPAGVVRSQSGVGGTVRVRCVGGVPQLISEIPRQGFAVEGDDAPAEVRFSSDSHRTEIKVACVAGQPRFTVEEDARRGGDDDDSGPGGGDDD